MKAAINRTHKATLLNFLNLRLDRTGDFFFNRIFFLKRPLRGEIEYSPVASLSKVS